MILHIAEDEKFLDHSITMFESVYPNKNIYLINTDQPLEYVKSKNRNILSFLHGTAEYSEVITHTTDIKAVIFHDLIHPYKWDLVVNLPKSLHLHWFCYGSELYNIPYLRDRLYLPSTKKLIQQKTKTKLTNWLEEISPLTYNKFYKVLKGGQTTFMAFKKAILRINSFSSPIESEISYVKKYLNPNIVYIPYHHVTLDHMVASVKNQVCNAQHFLVGNSANPTNNHLDTFKLLDGINSNYRVYVPLSYPKNETYINTVKMHGDIAFGDNFKPLTNFMPIEDYSNILKECGNVVLNFNRQQGIANIVLALYLGAKVYLNDNNISYQYLKNVGFKLYHINSLESNVTNTNFEDLANHNRIILEKIYARDMVIKTAHQLVNRLVQ